MEDFDELVNNEIRKLTSEELKYLGDNYPEWMAISYPFIIANGEGIPLEIEELLDKIKKV